MNPWATDNTSGLMALALCTKTGRLDNPATEVAPKTVRTSGEEESGTTSNAIMSLRTLAENGEPIGTSEPIDLRITLSINQQKKSVHR